MDTEEIRVEGQLAAVVFYNETNGYGIAKIDAGDEVITLTGTMPKLSKGEHVRAVGVWTTHPQFGRQVKVSAVESTLPAEAEGIRAFLGSGAIRGIGPVMAERLVARFGAETLSVLRDDPQRVADISGISVRRAQEMGAAFAAQNHVRLLMSFLLEHGIPAEYAAPLFRMFGEQAVDLLTQEPYLLTEDPFYVTFSLVDSMALSLGLSEDDQRRVKAAILFELRLNMEDGHAFLPYVMLTDVVQRLIHVSSEAVEEAKQALADAGSLALEMRGQRQVCYLPELYEAEKTVADRLRVRSTELTPPRGLDQIIRRVETETKLALAPMQKEALTLASRHSAMILTGGPGTGKTTTLLAMLTLFDRLGLTVMLAAPTGRAAKRMSELTGRDAKTIHRLLEVDFDHESGRVAFIHNENAPLNTDAVVIDEMSMVDVLLMRALVAALRPDTRLILVGDPDQLPSVGPGHVLHDLIKSRAMPVVRLTEVFRQARESHIVLQAHAVNRGHLEPLRRNDNDFFFLSRKTPEAALTTILELCAERLPNNLKLSPAQIQVLSPTRRGVTGTVSLNTHLQERLNPHREDKPECRWGSRVFRQGDRVMQLRNNYDLPWKRVDGEAGLGVFNGDVGIVLQVDAPKQELTVLFDDRTVLYPFDLTHELDMAYAVTVHKAQGSEYDAVVLAAMPGPPMLMTRRVLYTAITRACKTLIIVGQEETLELMCENSQDRRRYSGLLSRMKAEE